MLPGSGLTSRSVVSPRPRSDPTVQLARRHIKSALDVIAGALLPGGLDEIERDDWHSARARLMAAVEAELRAFARTIETDRTATGDPLPRSPISGRLRVW